MFTSSVMSLGESIVISALGLTIVFIVLILLAILILLFSKIFEVLIPKEMALGKNETEKKVKVDNDEEYAVLISAIHEEMRNLKGKFKITSLKEIK